MAKKSRGTKYVYKGTTFASSFEANIAHTLDAMGVIWEYEPVRIPWEPSKAVKYYTPDFLVKEKDGTEYFIEAKGFFEPHARTKMLAVKKQHPDLDIRLCFMNPKNKIKKQTYQDWARIRGYPVVELEIQSAPNVQCIDTETTPSRDTKSSGKTSRKTSKPRAQSISITGRNTRAKDGNIQTEGEAKSAKDSARSSSSFALCA